MIFPVRPVTVLSVSALIFLMVAVTSAGAPLSPEPEYHEKTIAAIHCDYAPVSFLDKNTGKPSGFFVEIMQSISGRAGLDVEYSCKDGWPEIISALESGEADIGALIKSGERKKKLLFSSPINVTYLSFFARSKSRIDENRVPEGYTVGVVNGSISHDLLKTWPGLRLQIQSSYQHGIFSLLAGHIDLFAGEESMILTRAREIGIGDRIRKVGDSFLEQERCLVTGKKNVQLLDRLNKALKGFIGSPEYQRIYIKWFGTPEPYWNIRRTVIAGSVFLFIAVCAMALWRHRSIVRINKELVRSEKQFRALFDNAPLGIVITDTEMRIVNCNAAFQKMLGYNQGELPRFSVPDISHADDHAASRGYYQAMIGGEMDHFTVENRYIRKDGTVLWTNLTGTVMRAEKDSAPVIFGILEDITERKQAAESLRASEKRYRTLFNQSPDGVLLIDAQGGFADFNDQACGQLGYTREEFKNLRLPDIDAGQSPEEIRANMHEVTRAGKAEFEVKHRAKNGDIRDVQIIAQTIHLSGQPFHHVVWRDITERKRAEAELQLSRQWLSLHMQQTPLAVVELSLDGRIREWNPAAARIFGYTREEALGRHWHLMVPESLRRSMDEFWEKRALQSGSNSTNKNVTKDGRILDCEWFNTPLVDPDGKTIGLVSLGLDVTERKQAEEALRRHREELVHLVEERTRELTEANAKLRREIAERERMEAELLKSQKLDSLGILAGGIAHDFNNLLATILSNISVASFNLSEGRPASKQLTGAERALLQARNLAQQLLTFSKGGVPVKRTQSLVELIRESADIAMRSSRVRCDFSIPDDLWLVDADEGQLSQVIHNLVINADQSMPEGGTIEVLGENIVLDEGEVSFLPAGRYVKVMVTDTGVGIPAEHLSKIFDPYFTTKQRGSGLGLATTHSIVQKHGGTVVVESAQGAGTTFTVYLPASNTAQAAKLIEDSRPHKGTGRVLFMDDNVGLRQATSDGLHDLGYSVVCAEDGVRAIELYQEAMHSGHPFDVVFVDITIRGGMGGQETLKRLTKIDPGVRAIVCSGYSNDPVMADYRGHGFVDVLVKPYNLNQLSQVVHRVMTGSESTATANPDNSEQAS